jgi:hypothetical protein
MIMSAQDRRDVPQINERAVDAHALDHFVVVGLGESSVLWKC